MKLSELEGKTIKKAQIHGIRGCDDRPYLILEMTDLTKYKVIASYGSYTGNSEDEYPVFISTEKVPARKGGV